MKIKCSVLALFVLAAWNLRADDFQITERGPDYRVWSKTTVENGTNRVHQYMELATGLYYTNSSGQLTESREEISPLPGGGAAAIQGRHQVYFPSDIYDGVIEVVTPDGRHLKSRPLGVSYDDGSNTVWIARLKHSEGELVSSNQVIYPDAFTDFKADLVCTYRRGSFESDLVCRESPPTPDQYGLNNASATLQLVTEFFDTADPREKTGQADKKYKLRDKTLKFGDLTMIQGKAFSVTTTNTVSPHRISVYKSWVHTQNRTFLIEEVPVKYLANDLSTLPASTNVQGSKITGKLRMASNQRQWLPTHQVASRNGPMQMAAMDLNQKSGVVLDYYEIDTDQTYFTFLNGWTYLISGPVNMGDGSEDGTSVEFNGGSVIKFTTNAATGIYYDQFDVTYSTNVDTPTVLTSKDDDSVGEIISDSTGHPVTMTNVMFLPNCGTGDGVSGVNTPENFAIYYAGVGLGVSDPTYLNNCQFYNCYQSIQITCGEVDLFNCLFSKCFSAIAYTQDGGYYDDSENFNEYGWASYWSTIQYVTADQLTQFIQWPNYVGDDQVNLNAANCIFTDIPYLYSQLFYYCWGDGSDRTSIMEYPAESPSFVGVLSGLPYVSADRANYYIASNSVCHNHGSTNISSPFPQMTTYAPQDGGRPDINGVDIGYHYPTNEDSDYDGIPDWWIWQNFGNYDESGTNLDAQGNTFLSDYQNDVDPTSIAFMTAATNNYVNVSQSFLPVKITTGTPWRYAVVVDSTNLMAAVWTNYVSTNIPVNLGTNEGWHLLAIGLRGYPTNGVESWQLKRLKLDFTPPQLVITSPTNTTRATPLLELQGYSPEALASITYDLTNAAGLITNQPVEVLNQTYTTNTWEYTTNTFQAFDLMLTNGLNVITLHATDLAGNITVTNFSYTLDYTTGTNPVMQLTWPTNGMSICASNITLRGLVDDPLSSVTASITDTNGDTNVINGEVERTGVLWAENLPLAEGTNWITLQVTNSAGFSSTTNISVVKSDMTFTLTSVSGDLWQSTVGVSGTISDSTATISVNGVQGTNNGDGTWTVSNVPVSTGGVASFDAQATPAGGGGSPAPSTSGFNLDKPSGPYLFSYTHLQTDTSSGFTLGLETGTAGWNTGNTLNYTFWWAASGGTGTYFISSLWRDWSLGSPDPGNGANNFWSSDVEYNWDVTGNGTALETDYTHNYENPPTINMYTNNSSLGDQVFNEHCNVQDQSSDYQQITPTFAINTTEQYNRTAQATWHLRTGGKGMPGQKNLWCLSATASQVLDKRAVPTDFQPNVGITNFTQIIMGGFGALKADGKLWVAEEDGVDKDMTPQVSGMDFYIFSPDAQEYLMHITANGIDISTNTPTFCVGQYINFDLSSSPPFSDAVIHWTLPGTFVNATPYSYCPAFFNENPALLNSDFSEVGTLSTFCWYADALQNGTATAAVNFSFPNGQTVLITHSGNFNIYRPSLAYWSETTAGLYIWNNQINVGEPNYGVVLSCDVKSSYSGQALITQIFDDGSYPASDNFGSNVLDKAEEYPGTAETIHANQHILDNIALSDSPGNVLEGDTTTLVLQFRDYIRFMPDAGPGPNIFVTLGKVTWNVDGWAELVDGTWQVLPTSAVSTPVLDQGSTEFPYWTSVH